MYYAKWSSAWRKVLRASAPTNRAFSGSVLAHALKHQLVHQLVHQLAQLVVSRKGVATMSASDAVTSNEIAEA